MCVKFWTYSHNEICENGVYFNELSMSSGIVAYAWNCG